MPLAVLQTEARIARAHANQHHETTAVLLRAAVIDVLMAGTHLADALELLHERD